MRLDPATAPGAHGSIGGTDGQGYLLGVLFRMFMGSQNDPGTHGERLWSIVSTNEMLKLLGFLSG